MKKFITANWIYILIILQPLLDMLYYFQKVNNLTPTTWIIRIALLTLTTGIIFFKSKNKKELIIKTSPFIVFYILHILNLKRVNTLDLIADTKYYLYVFELPVLTILFIDYLKDHEQQTDKIKKGILTSFIIIGISLLLSVLTNTEQCTYELKGSCVGLLGWFEASDTVFLILCALAPWALYYTLKKYNIAIYTIMCIATYLILYTNASKSCYYTLVLSFIVMIYICIMSKKLKHKYFKLATTIVFLGLSLYSYNNSFTFYRQNLASDNVQLDEKIMEDILDLSELENKTDNKSNENKNRGNDNKDENYKNKVIELLKTSYYYREIIDLHGEDAVYDALNGKITAETLSDNRLRKIINARIEQRKSDTITHYLGFGYSKVTAYSMDLENDITAIYFFYGYIGFALYMSYIIYFIYLLFKTFIKHPKIIFNSDIVILSFLFVILVLAGEYTGAFLRKPNSNIYLVMYLAMLYYQCKNFDNSKNIKTK